MSGRQQRGAKIPYYRRSLSDVGTSGAPVRVTDVRAYHGSRCRAVAAAVCFAVVAGVNTLGAQQSPLRPAIDSTVTVVHSGRRVRRMLVTRRQVLITGAAIAATATIAPFDRRSAAFMQAPRLQRVPDLRHAANDAAFMGGAGPFLLGAALFAGGRITGARPIADVGLHLTEGVLLAATITGLGKGLSGRALPQHSADPGDIEFGRGFHRGNGPYVSFPSGHAAAGFAMAAVLTSETSRWRPNAAKFVGPLAYGGATVIGLARMYQNVHWASDLPLAALIGTWSGMAVVSHQHAHPRNRLDRWLLGTGVAPSGHGGVVLTWSIPAGGVTQ